MVDVEQRPLRPFEQQPAACLDGVEQEGGGVGDVRLEPLCIGGVLGVDRRGVERRWGGPGPVGEQPVFEVDDVLHLRAEVGAVEVAEPDRQRTADLVAVAGPDAAAGGADRAPTGKTAVEEPILDDVPREDDVGPVAELEFAVHADAPRLEAVHFVDHLGGIENHATGDHAGHPVAKNAAGNDREFPGLAVGDDGVPGVCPARVADDDLVLFRQDVDEFALGFVSPLQADDAGAGHVRRVLRTRKRRRCGMRSLR